jgi:hypothetical protein
MAITLLAFIREVLGSFPDVDTDYLDKGSS